MMEMEGWTRPSKQCKSLICKGTEEHGGGQIIQMVICNNPCLSVPLILVIWRTVLFASDHLQRYGGDWIIWMIICNNSCSFVPLLLVIWRTVLFANDRYWLLFGGTGSVWGCTGWYLVILGQYNLVLFGFKGSYVSIY